MKSLMKLTHDLVLSLMVVSAAIISLLLLVEQRLLREGASPPASPKTTMEYENGEPAN